MPSIGKFVIGNVSTLQSASNMFVNTAGYKNIHATSSNVELAFKNIDDAIESTIATAGSPLAAAADFYVAITASNTMTGDNTFSGKLTASNGLHISGGEFVANKNILTADSNAGASGDSIMLFDASDSDLAKTITISQLSTLVDTGGDSADFYAALTASNTFTGGNTFSGDVTASQGMLLPDDTKLFFGTDKDVSLQYQSFNGFLWIDGANIRISDDKTLGFGTGGDATIEYDENGTDELRFAGAAARFEQNVAFEGDVTLGNAATDAIAVTGKLTASNGLVISNHLTADDGTTTVSSKLTASNGLVVTDHFTATDGTTTFNGNLTTSGKLTASNGINISGGELVADKNILTADSNAGASGDSIILFDSSDSDLAKTITISQLGTLVNTGGDAGDFYLALTGSNTMTGDNTFSGDLTASQGLTSLAAINCNGNITGLDFIAQGAITASNGLAISTSDDGSSNAALTVTSASFIAQGPEVQILATSTVTVGGDTTFTGNATVQGGLTASNGFTVTSPDSAKGSATSFEVSHDGTITLGIEGLGVSIPGATTFFSDLTASGGALISSNDTSTVPALTINQAGAGDAAMSFAISGDVYTMGIDNNDSDLFKVSYASALGSNDLFEMDSNGNIKIGSNSSASPTGSATDNSLFISSTHKAFLHLEGDSDNSDEEGTAYIKFEQDGGAVQAIIGTIGGGNDLDPEGNAYDGTFDNNLLIGTQENFGMQLGTNSIARVEIKNGGKVHLLSTKDETTATSANLVINSSTGLLARSTSDRRQKHTITSITSSLTDVCQLEPRYFYDAADVSGSVKLVGLVADEVQNVFPELIPERDLPDEIYKSVSYDRLAVYLVNALKEIKQRLENLEGD